LGVSLKTELCLMQNGLPCHNFIVSELHYWCMPIIPALGRLRQEDLKFESSLGYVVRPVSKKQP
jgi:hypothetical protein